VLLEGLAREVLARVLGAAQGRRVFEETLLAMKLVDLASADDLYEFGDRLTARGGFEAAVCRLLSVAAVMRGARGK
jgi:hypothetical protein